jgi:predicted secreted protein
VRKRDLARGIKGLARLTAHRFTAQADSREVLAASAFGRIVELERRLGALERLYQTVCANADVLRSMAERVKAPESVEDAPAATPGQTSPATLSNPPGTVDGGSLATLWNDLQDLAPLAWRVLRGAQVAGNGRRRR